MLVSVERESRQGDPTRVGCAVPQMYPEANEDKTSVAAHVSKRHALKARGPRAEESLRITSTHPHFKAFSTLQLLPSDSRHHNLQHMHRNTTIIFLSLSCSAFSFGSCLPQEQLSEHLVAHRGMARAQDELVSVPRHRPNIHEYMYILVRAG